MSLRRVRKTLDNNVYFKGYTLNLRNLTKEQEEYLENCVGSCRKIYNWTLDIFEKWFEDHKNDSNLCLPTDLEIQKMLSEYRNQNEWLQKVPLGTLRNAMYDVINTRYFCLKDGAKNIKYYPKHKTKKHSRKSFSPRADRCYMEDNLIKIEGIDEKIDTGWHSGWMKSDEKDLNYKNVRVFKDCDGKWKVSFTVTQPKVISTNYDNLYETYTPSYDRPIGIDLNKKNLIVTSYEKGEIYKLPDTVEKYYEEYIKLHKKVEKDIKTTMKQHPEIANLDDYEFSKYKSKNAIRRQIKCNKARRKVANIIDTYAHTVAKKIITRYPKAIVMENIDIKEMYSRHNTAKGISYIPLGKIRRIFQDKCDTYNVPFILARKDYPSTQRCSCCGNKKKMGSKHTYICPVCGNVMDRDINAAFNLEQYYNYTDALIWIK